MGVTQNRYITGRYRDVLAGPRDRLHWDSGWQSNLIVQGCNLLLAALLKGDSGLFGLLYWAIGEGSATWDAVRPQPLLTDAALAAEILRQPLAPDQIVYLDENGDPTGSISNRLEISAEFRGEEIVAAGFQPLREFGLFGGNATETAGSGLMIDYVIHPRIDLTADVTLSRRLQLTFASGAVKRREIQRFGMSLPAACIDGVGEHYAGDLSAQGIRTLGDLLSVDPTSPVGRIPPVKLREFCMKARMVAAFEASLLPVESLAGMTISRFLQERPEDVVNAVGIAGIAATDVKQLQDELAVLQVAMDDVEVQRLTLGDLLRT